MVRCLLLAAWREFNRDLWNHGIIRNAVICIEAKSIRQGLAGHYLEWEWSSTRSCAGWADVPLKIDPIAWEMKDTESKD